MRRKLIGPIKQLLTLNNLPLKGALSDDALEIISNAGILVNADIIEEIGNYNEMSTRFTDCEKIEFSEEIVVLPGFIDCHTHITFGGNRANDFSMRNSGKSYLEIAEQGGGIWSTVNATRACSLEDLTNFTIERTKFLMDQGITTVEVKSGYGLSVSEELKMLRAIKNANDKTPVDLISTCLAAHTVPKDFQGTVEEYLNQIINDLLPVIKAENLSNRVDAFIEKSAFSADEIKPFFQKAKEMDFDITVHADQFSTSGSAVAIEFSALSADHLEASTDYEIAQLAKSDVVAVALPAASLGLGCAFTPARKLLDAGACLAIASDWNPGSAPMGNLLIGASVLATAEKLSNAEVFSALTFRAAQALNLNDRGILKKGMKADLVFYQTDNYQNILYLQGQIKPYSVWKNGEVVFNRA